MKSLILVPLMLAVLLVPMLSAPAVCADGPTFGEVTRDMERGRAVAVPEGFRATFRAAVAEARSNREIGLIQNWRLNAASNNPRQLQRIYAGVVDEGIRAGTMDPEASTYGFDWESILAFIRELIPLILQLISIFS